MYMIKYTKKKNTLRKKADDEYKNNLSQINKKNLKKTNL